MKLYQRRAGIVEAIQFDGKNAEEVAAFCHGRVTYSGLVCIDAGPNITYARPGTFVVKRFGGFAVMDEGEFKAQYEPATSVQM